MSALSREARAIVARGKPGDGPTTADRARVLAKLEVGWAAASASRPPHAARSPARLVRSVYTKRPWSSLSAVALLSTAAWFGLRRTEPAPAESAAWSASAAPRSSASEPVQPEAAAARPESPAPLTAAKAPRRLFRSATARARPATQPALEAAAGPAPRIEREPIEAPALDGPPPSASETEQPLAAPEFVRSARAAPPSAALEHGATNESLEAHSVRLAPAELAVQPIEDELALLGAAQSALARGKYQKALQYVQQHAFRFPHGALAPERMATQTLALCASGRPNQARQVFASLKALLVSSPLLDRVRRDCGF